MLETIYFSGIRFLNLIPLTLIVSDLITVEFNRVLKMKNSILNMYNSKSK